jgi:hypothetical protein
MMMSPFVLAVIAGGSLLAVIGYYWWRGTVNVSEAHRLVESGALLRLFRRIRGRSKAIAQLCDGRWETEGGEARGWLSEVDPMVRTTDGGG